jgi:hypothetical protein
LLPTNIIPNIWNLRLKKLGDQVLIYHIFNILMTIVSMACFTLYNLFAHGNHIDRKKRIIRKRRSCLEVLRVIYFWVTNLITWLMIKINVETWVIKYYYVTTWDVSDIKHRINTTANEFAIEFRRYGTKRHRIIKKCCQFVNGEWLGSPTAFPTEREILLPKTKH